MKKVLTLLTMPLLLTGCVNSSIQSYSNQITSYTPELEHSEFCQSIIQEDEIMENCRHQLVIYTRSVTACADTPNPDSCQTLNKNLWMTEVYQNRDARKAVALYTNTDFDPIALHKNMLTKAPSFTLLCSYEPEIKEVCKTQ